MNDHHEQEKSALPNLNTVSPTLIPPIPAPGPAPVKRMPFPLTPYTKVRIQ